MSTALKMFLSQVIIENGTPFQPKLKLDLAIEELNRGEYDTFNSISELMKDALLEVGDQYTATFKKDIKALQKKAQDLQNLVTVLNHLINQDTKILKTKTRPTLYVRRVIFMVINYSGMDQKQKMK